MNKTYRSYLIITVISILLIVGFAGCGKAPLAVTVTLNGTDNAYSATGDWYVAIAEGTFGFTASTTPTEKDVLEIKKFTPGTTTTVKFSVSAESTYTVFVFQDTGDTPGSYDAADQATGANIEDLIYLEEDKTVTLDFYY